MKTIVITTDFGDQLASAQLQAVMATLGFTGKIIENHSVRSFSILEGAYAMKLVAAYAPKDAVHLGVVDPGVGSTRDGIIIQTTFGWLVGPDNGLLYPAAQEHGIKHVWKIHENKISNHVSNTFHGRDVFIKAAVFLAQDTHPNKFHATPILTSDIIPLEFAEGQILHIDDYGDIKIHWPHRLTVGKKLTVTWSRQTITVPIVRTFSDVAEGKPLALLSSSGTLELAVNLRNAANYFDAHVGDTFIIGYAPQQ